MNAGRLKTPSVWVTVMHMQAPRDASLGPWPWALHLALGSCADPLGWEPRPVPWALCTGRPCGGGSRGPGAGPVRPPGSPAYPPGIVGPVGSGARRACCCWGCCPESCADSSRAFQKPATAGGTLALADAAPVNWAPKLYPQVPNTLYLKLLKYLWSLLDMALLKI